MSPIHSSAGTVGLSWGRRCLRSYSRVMTLWISPWHSCAMPCAAATRTGYSHPLPALALVPSPKQRHLWAAIAHRGALDTLDEFKATWEGRLTYHGDTPKILQGNLAPAAIAHWWISLESYPSSRRNWLVCNLAYRIEWHNVLHKMHAGPTRRTQIAATERLSLPGVFQTRSTYQSWAHRA